MSLLHRRPLASLCTVIVLSFVLVAVLPFYLICGGLGLLLLLVIFFGAKRKRPPIKWGISCIVILTFAMGIHLFSYVIPQQKVVSLSDSTHSFIGKVTDRTVFEDGQSLTVKLKKVDGKREYFSVSFYLSDKEIRIGDRIFFQGEIYPLEEDENILFAKADGVVGEIDLLQMPTVTGRSFSMKEAFRTLNSALSHRLATITDGKDGGLFSALLLGNKSYLDANTSLSFRRAGISHLLAISGLHLTVLLAFLQKMLKRTKLPVPFVHLLCFAFILFYSALAGGTSSILRAAFMSSFGLLAWFFGRKNDGFTSLFFAAALLLVFSKGTVYDVGFWLSFLATFGILLSAKMPKIKKLCHIFKEKSKSNFTKAIAPLFDTALQMLLVTLFATVFALPLCCMFFEEVSLFGMPATLLLSPIVNLMLVLGLPLLLLSFLPFLGGILGEACSILSKILLFFAKGFSGVSFAAIAVNYPLVEVFAAAFVVLLFLLPLVSPKIKKHAYLALGAVGVILASSLLIGNLSTARQNYLAYTEQSGQDFILVQEKKDIMLFDLSSGNSKGASYALSALREYHLTRVDRLVLTHLHSGHTEMLKKMASQVLIKRIYLPHPVGEQEETYQTLLNLAEGMGIEVISYEDEKQIVLGDTAFRFYSGPTLPQNNHSAFALSLEKEGKVLMIASADFTFLTPSNLAIEDFCRANTLILSGHGGVPATTGYLPITEATERLIVARKGLSFLLAEETEKLLSQIQLLEQNSFTLSFK